MKCKVTALKLFLLCLTLLAAPAFFAGAQPVTDHPRLLFRAGDLPALRARMNASNDVWMAFKQSIVDPAYVDWLCSCTQYETNGLWVRSSFTDQFGVVHTPKDADWISNGWYNAQLHPAAPEQDNGAASGNLLLASEQYALLFAFMSLLETNAPMHSNYVAAAKECLFKVVDSAVLGDDDTQPFRSSQFPLGDRGFMAEDFPLATDWLYSELTPLEKAKIRKTFLIWENQIQANPYYAPYNPNNLVNDPALFNLDTPDHILRREDLRFALNNHYANRMRAVGMYALSIDPADDLPNASLNDTNPPGALTGFATGPGGANDWVYQNTGYVRAVTGSWLYLTDTAMRTDGAGGISMESTEYAPNGVGPTALLMCCLNTAGQDNIARWGSQVAFTNNPFWSQVIPGYLAFCPPRARIITGSEYLGAVYQPPVYGDLEQLDMINDQQIKYLAPMALYDWRINGTTGAVVQAVRYIQRNLAVGGPGKISYRIATCRGEQRFRDPIYYFLLFDPSAPAPADPRPALQPLTFYAAHDPAGKSATVMARSDATTNATYFDFRLAWNRIDHQCADSLGFGFWKNGLWLTKVMDGYGVLPSCADYRNSLSLQNGVPTSTFLGEDIQAAHGSQWQLDPAGDPQMLAHSLRSGFLYVTGDATPLYDDIDQPSLQEILHASRSIVWLKPNYLVIYDRAKSKQAGYFKRFWLNLPETPTISGNVVHATAREGTLAKAELFITSLLPAGAVPQAADISSGNPAGGEDMQARMFTEAPGNPQEARFLHVLQGADAGVSSPAGASLVQSSGTTAFEGAVMAGKAVLFMKNTADVFTNLIYTVTAGIQSHYITGLSPNSGYDFFFVTNAGHVTVTITPSGTAGYADGGGVLLIGTSEPAEVSLTASAPNAAEGGASGAFTLRRNGDVTAPLTVNYSLGGTAINGVDYTALPGVVTFAAGSPNAIVSVTPIDDNLFEGAETVVLTLQNSTGYTPSDSANTATVTIADNDAPPGGCLQFASANYSAQENSGAAVITVQRTGGSSGAVTVQFGTANGTAKSGTDFTATSGTLSWPDGDSSPRTFSVPLIDDNIYEGSRSLLVTLGGVTGQALINTPSASLTVLDNETPPPGALQLDAAGYVVGQTTGFLTIPVHRTGGTGGAASVNFATVNGTALAGSDFVATNGTLAWPDGDASDRLVAIALINNAAYSPAKTFTFVLSGATVASLGVPATATISVTNNNPVPAIFDVGTNQPYPTLGSVPWTNLSAGSTVRIHYGPAYHEKILISSVGTSNAPVCIVGVPGPAGERPVIDGDRATTSAVFNYVPYPFYADTGMRSLVSITRNNSQSAATKPAYVVFDGFELRNGNTASTVTNANGTTSQYTSVGGGLFIAAANHVTIRNCVIHDCANGITVASGGGGENEITRNLLVERCYVYSNGVSGNYYGYNFQGEADGVTLRFNRFGRPNCGGNVASIRDRSAGFVALANWFEGGGYMLELIDPQNARAIITNDPAWNCTAVVGNIFKNGAGDYNTDGSSLVHFGSTYGSSALARPGGLLFLHNTVVVNSQRYQTKLFYLDSTNETVEAQNNIFHCQGGTSLLVNSSLGVIHLGTNWITTGWAPGGGTVAGSVNLLAGTSPGFINFSNCDFHLTTNSPCLNVAQPLAGAATNFPATVQYVPHQNGVLRYPIGVADLGAFELQQPMDAWRLANFGLDAANPAVADDLVSPAGDGVNNLWKYTLGLAPFAVARNSEVPAFYFENNYLTVAVNRSPTVTDVSWFVDVSSDLVNWYAGATNSFNVQKSPQLFLRVRLTRP